MRNGWTVRVDWDYPDGVHLHPSVLDRLDEAMRGRGLVLAVPSDSSWLGLTFAINECHRQVAKDVAIQIIDDALNRSGLPPGKLNVRSITAQAELDREIEALIDRDLPSAKVLSFLPRPK